MITRIVVLMCSSYYCRSSVYDIQKPSSGVLVTIGLLTTSVGGPLSLCGALTRRPVAALACVRKELGYVYPVQSARLAYSTVVAEEGNDPIVYIVSDRQVLPEEPSIEIVRGHHKDNLDNHLSRHCNGDGRKTEIVASRYVSTVLYATRDGPAIR